MKKKAKRSKKGRLYTGKLKQARIIARSAYQNISQIAKAEGVSRGTVYRIRNSAENAMMLQAFRDEVLNIVPSALKTLIYHVKKKNLTAAIETLYGARVLIQRHEVEKVEEPVRTYDLTRAEFFIQHGRWPTEKEVLEYDKTLEVEPLVKGSLTE